MIKIIPDLDKNQKFVQFSQTIFGKLTLSLIFSLILWLSANANFLVWPCIIFLFSIMQSKKVHLIIFLNLAYWLLADGLFQSISFNNPDKVPKNIHLLEFLINSLRIDLPQYLNTQVFYIFTSLTGISLIVILNQIYLRYLCNKIPVVIFLGLIILPATFFLSSLQKDPIIFLLIAGILIIYIKSFWFIAFALDDQRLLPHQNSIKLSIGSFAPFWYQNAIRPPDSLPRGFSELTSTETRSAEEYAKCQIKGIKLAIWAHINIILASATRAFLFGVETRYPIFSLFSIPSLNLPSPMDLTIYNQLHIPLYIKWLTLLSIPFIYITWQLVGVLGLLVAFLRLLGFRIKRGVYKPHHATNFGQFFQRVYFYYNSILVQFFFFPISRFLRKLNFNRKTHIFYSIFLSILLGGIFLEFIKNPELIVSIGPIKTFQIIFNRTLYFIGIGLASGLSSIWIRPISTEKGGGFHPLRFAILYSIYSIFFFLQGNLSIGTLHDRVTLLLSLFTITLD